MFNEAQHLVVTSNIIVGGGGGLEYLAYLPRVTVILRIQLTVCVQVLKCFNDIELMIKALINKLLCITDSLWVVDASAQPTD